MEKISTRIDLIKKATNRSRRIQSHYCKTTSEKEISMNLAEQTKSLEIVPKRHAFKAQVNNNSGLINWVDFADVRGHFSYLSNRILQAVFTQPAKESPSFLACCLINSSKSSSKRIVCLVLLDLSYDFLILSCIGSHLYDKLLSIGSNHCIGKYHKKQSPEVLPTLSRDLTKPLNLEVMIMANRYDSAHLCARQSKLYKFYDLSTAQVVQSIAPTERQARKNLGKQSLIFIARKPLTPTFERSITWGGYRHA